MNYNHIKSLIAVYEQIDAIVRPLKGKQIPDSTHRNVMRLMTNFVAIAKTFPKTYDVGDTWGVNDLRHITDTKFKDECKSILEMLTDTEDDLFVKMKTIPPVYLERVLPVAFMRHFFRWLDYPIYDIDGQPWFDDFFGMYGAQVIQA